MFSRKFPELSATCGINSDGIPLGAINDSPFLGVELLVPFATNIVAVRKDVGTGGTMYTPLTTEANAGVTNGFLPWGTDATFGAGDFIAITADQDVCELYPYVDTPAQFVGDGLEVLESLDGQTFTPVTGLVDGSDGFRNSGVSRIKFDVGARQPIKFEYDKPALKYIIIRPKNLTSATVSPKLSKIIGACQASQTQYIDQGTAFNKPLTDADFSPANAAGMILITDTTHTVMVSPGRAKGMFWQVFQSLEDLSTMLYEYWNGTAWTAFTGLNDASNGVENGPTALGATGQKFLVTWDLPTTWPSATMTFSGRTYTGYFYRIRPSSITQYRPSRTGLVRARVHSFGADAAGGVYHQTAKTYMGIVFEAAIAPTAALNLSFADANTGDGRSVTWPGGSANSWDVSGNRLMFDSAFTIPAGGQLMLSVSGSGVVYDVTVSLLES